MSKLSELRARANNTKEVHAQRTARIADAVRDVVNSNAFNLTAATTEVNPESKQEVNEFVNAVAERVTTVISNPINSFIDTMRARGMSNKHIGVVVEQLNKVFELTDSQDYETQLKAVATYLETNPNLYDEIGILNVKS